MLTDLSHSLSLIGLTETKYKISEDSWSLCYHIIPGNSFISQPSLSNAGGAGFFVAAKLNNPVGGDLSQPIPMIINVCRLRFRV